MLTAGSVSHPFLSASLPSPPLAFLASSAFASTLADDVAPFSADLAATAGPPSAFFLAIATFLDDDDDDEDDEDDESESDPLLDPELEEEDDEEEEGAGFFLPLSLSPDALSPDALSCGLDGVALSTFLAGAALSGDRDRLRRSLSFLPLSLVLERRRSLSLRPPFSELRRRRRSGEADEDGERRREDFLRSRLWLLRR